MQRSLKLSGIFMVATAWCQFCLAEPLPAGIYPYALPCDQGVWDISGHSEYCEYGGALDDICLDMVLAQDGKGKFTGTGSGSAYYSGVDFDFHATVAGSVKSDGFATFKLNLTGSAYYGGDTYDFTGSGAFTGQADCQTLMLVGTVRGKACVSGYGCASSAPGEATLDLPAGMNGSWVLTLNVPTDGAELITASVRLSNAETLQMTAKTKYNASTDTTGISASGDKTSSLSSGAKIKAVVSGADFGIDALSGKILGQKLTVTP
ncbi:MAG: hypothetical protein PCFJNLEI_02730 [Verrucomicrobiae bacterium]|nr:hypothetical protein [Verrucomicrobiae bacterium]